MILILVTSTGIQNAREHGSAAPRKNKTKQNKEIKDGKKNQKNAWKKILRKRKERIQNTDFVP